MKIFAVAVALLVAVGACAKSNESSSSAASPVASVAMNPANSNDGGKVYRTNCSSCHQADGTGIEGTFPKLAGNPVVTGDPKRVIHIVKYGLMGKIDVAGETFNGIMPVWATQLSDADIASVVTYIRGSWGNEAGPVSEADVAAIKK